MSIPDASAGYAGVLVVRAPAMTLEEVTDRMQELQFLARVGRIDRGNAQPTRMGYWNSVFDEVDRRLGIDLEAADKQRRSYKPKAQKRHAPTRTISRGLGTTVEVPDEEAAFDLVAPVPPKPDVPAQVVVNQHLIHRLDEMQAEIRRLERRVELLEGRQSIDDIHDGPWNWTETPIEMLPKVRA